MFRERDDADLGGTTESFALCGSECGGENQSEQHGFQAHVGRTSWSAADLPVGDLYSRTHEHLVHYTS